MNCIKILDKVRRDKPLVHHITNWVTIYDCANIVKVFGASPVMAHAKEEVADMVKLASSLVLNIGTLTPEIVVSMKQAARSANKKNIPVILDVCGAGATPLRDRKCFELLRDVKIDVIKGNASEIARIAGLDVRTKGVDSTNIKKDPVDIAKNLAKKKKCTIVITGKEDIIADEKKCFIVKNGHAMMGGIVGTGCMAASVIGTFAAVHKDLAEAAAAGLVCYGIAGELAAKISKLPGTFKEKLFDCAYLLTPAVVKRHIKLGRR